MSMIRTFIAIPVPDLIKKYLCEIQRILQKNSIRASWVKPTAMHLTLKFIGDVEPARISDIQSCMAEVAKSTQAFDLEISRIGGFPSISRSKVIWAGLKGGNYEGAKFDNSKKELVSLANRLDALLNAQLGIKKEKKKYSPHLTLGRAKRPVNLNIVNRGVSVKSFRASKMILYKSTLHPSGAIHENIFSSKLGN